MKDTIEGGPASRLMRWNMKLLKYDFEVEHKPGKIHTDADAVSRLVAALMTVKPDRMVQQAPRKRYHDEQRRVHASKAALYDPDDAGLLLAAHQKWAQSPLRHPRRHRPI
jgi:hypothetical protein